MSALLVKDAPDGLHQWLKSEATFNRRSLNQQVLVCLEWCMKTYGEAQQRDPFALAPIARLPTPGTSPETPTTTHHYLRGRDLSTRLMSIESIDDATAVQMQKDASALRKQSVREFDYACFA